MIQSKDLPKGLRILLLRSCNPVKKSYVVIKKRFRYGTEHDYKIENRFYNTDDVIKAVVDCKTGKSRWSKDEAKQARWSEWIKLVESMR